MRLSIVAAAALLSFPALAAAQAKTVHSGDPQADLRKGIALFHEGNFAAALASFLRAQHAGLETPVLHYDCGATYYRLGRYREAATQFRLLLSDQRFGDFARYNLGLIARRRKDEALAQREFSAVARSARNLRLRALARAQSPRLNRSGVNSEETERPWHGMVEAGPGYDDNVALLPRYSPLFTAGGGSPLLRTYARADGWLLGDAQHGLSAAGSLYDTHYLRQSSFDLLIAKLGSAYRFPAGSWRIETGLYGTDVRLGGSELESIGSLFVSAAHRLGSTELHLDWTLERIGGGATYDYLTGYQGTFALRTTWQVRALEIEAGPAVTESRRRDLTAGGEFFSVSATRWQFDAYALWNAGERLRVYARGSYWRSRYRDPNIYFDRGELNVRRRVDGTSEAELGVLYDLSPSWHVGLEYGLRRNDSSIGSYVYSSDRYLLRLQYTY